MKLKTFTQTLFLLLLSFVHIAHAETKQPYQKPGANIRVVTPDIISLDVSKQKEVKVSFSAPSNGQLFITAKPKPGLTLASTHSEWHFDLASEKPEVTLNIEGNTNGKYYVMFHARIIEKSKTSSRVFGIPVEVGDVSALEAKLEKTGKKKEYVIMKAEETITQ
ncbi:hypothetical protein TDB9533_03215 [Thalassocella blandensis]|nr:hypothetical protein TDB9533_03215 [Thalassocella blandensis]